MEAEAAAKREIAIVLHAVRCGLSALQVEASARQHREALRTAGLGARLRALVEVAASFLVLGCTSFGGPNAQFAILQREYVERRRWIDPASYAELVALAQFLPGPLSSKVAIALGTYRAGVLGGIVGLTCYTMPAALLMIGVAFGIGLLGAGDAGSLKGLKAAAVAVVANAVWQMGSQLAPDRSRQLLLTAAAVAALMWREATAQIAILATACLIGLVAFDPGTRPYTRPLPSTLSRRFGALCLVLFFEILLILPAARAVFGGPWLSQFESFYRIGALVFGGGHVVLPLMEVEVVQTGWIPHDEFLAGYGVVQAAPGPLFVFAAYLGAVMHRDGAPILGGLWCMAAIFLPAFLLMFGILPFWDGLRTRRRVRAALMGVNAAVVGLVVAALYQPMWLAGVREPLDVAFVLAAFCALVFLRWPVWLVVVAAGGAGALRDMPLEPLLAIVTSLLAR